MLLRGGESHGRDGQSVPRTLRAKRAWPHAALRRHDCPRGARGGEGDAVAEPHTCLALGGASIDVPGITSSSSARGSSSSFFRASSLIRVIKDVDIGDCSGSSCTRRGGTQGQLRLWTAGREIGAERLESLRKLPRGAGVRGRSGPSSRGGQSRHVAAWSCRLVVSLRSGRGGFDPSNGVGRAARASVRPRRGSVEGGCEPCGRLMTPRPHHQRHPRERRRGRGPQPRLNESVHAHVAMTGQRLRTYAASAGARP